MTEEKKDEKRDREEKPPVKIKPAPQRIGESRDNLQQRGEWFERRSGGKQ